MSYFKWNFRRITFSFWGLQQHPSLETKDIFLYNHHHFAIPTRITNNSLHLCSSCSSKSPLLSPKCVFIFMYSKQPSIRSTNCVWLFHFFVLFRSCRAPPPPPPCTFYFHVISQHRWLAGVTSKIIPLDLSHYLLLESFTLVSSPYVSCKLGVR